MTISLTPVFKWKRQLIQRDTMPTFTAIVHRKEDTYVSGLYT